jgi:hypothetical protein
VPPQFVVPDWDNLVVYDLDASVPTEINVIAGTKFYTMVNETSYFPEGFAF